MKAVIMAGGKGTRITSVANGIPKPMITIAGKPVLEYEIENLRRQNYTDIIITVSHLGNIITDYFGDGSKVSPVTKTPFGVHIEYYYEKEALGNAGALFKLKDRLTEDFLLLNGDSMFEVDFERFVSFHKKKGGLVTLLTHPNTHPQDSGLIVTDENQAVTDWITREEKRPYYYKNCVNAGLHVVSPLILQKQDEINGGRVDLDRRLLKPLAGTGRMYAYASPEYVKDMGTPERYTQVCNDFEAGVISEKCLKQQQRAVFLDRDGTINRYAGFLRDIKDMELLPGVAKAIEKLNKSGYLVIVATNQPVIARGEVSVEQLRQIHNKLETLLGIEGAYVDDIIYCPHHPDRGYEGERIEYKTECDCRKPKAGMLYKAADRYNIALSQSWMVGDGEIDIKAGAAAGCRTALISAGGSEYGQDVTVESLEDFVERILRI